MKSIRRRLPAAVIATAAVALAAPVSGASAVIIPPSSGTQVGSAGCMEANRPSFGGNDGSTSAQACGALLSFIGPQLGQVSSVIGPTIIGSPLSQVNVSSGPITQVVP